MWLIVCVIALSGGCDLDKAKWQGWTDSAQACQHSAQIMRQQAKEMGAPVLVFCSDRKET